MSNIHQTLAATRIAAHAAPDLPVDRARPGEAGRHGTAVGRAVHGALEHAPFDDADVSALAREHAINEGVTGEAPRIESLIRAGLASDVVRAAAGARHWRELYVAAPLVDDPDSPVVEGFIDLAYLDGGPDEPGLVIVDYKTDAVVDDADRIAKASRYRLQGATYALAAERSTGLTVQRVVFCFLSGDGSVEVDIEDLPAAMAEVTDAVRDMTGV
jgi:ATP-dependent helicase/nuclease subunit A